ncbi:MAG: hypothetical protein Q9188_001463, partial [Gyalolechia gomerana]
MGGLLAADVALLAAGHDEGNRAALEHGILGVVGLDTPFLGMHPRIILSGLGSLFTRNSTETDLLNESGQSVNLEPPTNGELNDVLPCPVSTTPIPTDAIDENPALSSHSEYPTKFSPPPSITSKSKQSPWSRAFNFINKHSEDLTKASKAYLTSHLEFGGCMADYQGLKGRYERIRSFELSHERKVRFVNYYTASTGRPRKKKTQPPSAEGAKPRHSNSDLESTEEGMQEMGILDRETISYDRSRSPSINAEKNLTTTLDSLEQHSFNHELNSVGP